MKVEDINRIALEDALTERWLDAEVEDSIDRAEGAVKEYLQKKPHITDFPAEQIEQILEDICPDFWESDESYRKSFRIVDGIWVAGIDLAESEDWIYLNEQRLMDGYKMLVRKGGYNDEELLMEYEENKELYEAELLKQGL